MDLVRLTTIYLGVIGLTVIVQSAANRLMKTTADFFEEKDFPQKLTILMVSLMYIQIIAILIDISIWAFILLIIGIYTEWWDAFTFATDSFSTLGNSGNVEPPWEYIGPVMAINGIVIIAFGVSCLYSILYKA